MLLASHHACNTQNFEVAPKFLENLSTPKRIYSKHYSSTVSTRELIKSAQTKLFVPEFLLKGELNMNLIVKLVGRHFSQMCHYVCKHYKKTMKTQGLTCPPH